MAYQCLTGRPPFDGEPLAVALAHRQQPLPPLPPWVPAEVAALVADLTAKDPRARWRARPNAGVAGRAQWRGSRPVHGRAVTAVLAALLEDRW